MLLLFLSFFAFAQAPQLTFSADFNTDLKSDAGEDPFNASGVSLVPGFSGNGAEIKDGDILIYPANGNVIAEKGSLSFWVKPNWNPGTILHRFFVFGEDPRNIEVHLDEDSNLAFTANTWAANDLPGVFLFAGAGEWKAQEWYFLTYTWDEQRMRIFVNGQLVSEQAIGFTIPTVTDDFFRLGSFNGFEALDGIMDEVKIYDAPLSSETIKTNYRNNFCANFGPDITGQGDDLTITNLFGDDITAGGLTLVDWEGPIANPAMKYFISGPDSLSYPVNVTIASDMPGVYFNSPSLSTSTSASKTIVLESAGQKVDFLMATFMDKDGEEENFEVTLTYGDGCWDAQQKVAVHIIDQDYERPLSYPVTLDFSEETHPFINNDTIQSIVTQAAKDWAYYLDGSGLDTYSVGESSISLWSYGRPPRDMFNKTAYKGFYLFVVGNLLTDPCICSTGFPSDEFQMSNGQQMPIPRMGGHALNVLGNFNENGFYKRQPYEDWKIDQLANRTDVYGLARHEIGHAMVYEFGLPAYQKFIDQGFIKSPAIERYYPGGQFDLLDDAPLHLIYVVDPASQQAAYAAFSEIMPSGENIMTKLDVLIMEAVGYPLRKNEVTRPLSMEISDSVGRKDQNYSAQLLGKGGVPVYQYTWLSGDLPMGLQMDEKGQITGMPQETGFFPIQVKVKDYSLHQDSASVEVILHILRQEAALIDVSVADQISTAQIDQNDQSIVLNVPANANLRALAPTFVVSQGARLTPESGSVQDFSNPVSYTITSEDGTITQQWTVSAVADISSAVLDQMKISQLNTFPNPNNGFFQLDLSLTQAESVTIRMLSANGQVLQNQRFDSVLQLNENLDLTEYSVGTYILQVLIDDRLAAWTKLVVQ